jgi:hypothetical protein
MLSSVLSSERAVAVNIEIMRAFVRMRGVLAANKELAQRFAELETRLDKRAAMQDKAIAATMSAIRELMNPPIRRKRGIGFTAAARKWSGRWESNPPGTRFRAFKTNGLARMQTPSVISV